MENIVSVTMANALMMKPVRFAEAMESAIAETVTASLVGMEINANSSVTSARGRSKEDVLLQMAKSAAIEVHAFVESAHAMMLTPLVTGEISMVTLVSVMNVTAKLCTTDMLMTSVQDMDSATAADATARRDGQGRSANTRAPVLCRPRRARSGARGAVRCHVGEEENVSVASALASHQEIAESMVKTVNAMIGSVKILKEKSAATTASAPAAGVFVRMDGLGSSAKA